MTPANNNVLACPMCGASNFQGEEECNSCNAPLVLEDKTPDRGDRSFISLERIAALTLPTPVTVARETTLREALAKMTGAPDSSVLVVDGDDLVGIVTERDVLYKVAGKSVDLDRTTVAHIMTPDPVRLETSERISSAFNRMSVGGFRHVPVLKDGRVVGQLTMQSLLEYLRSREARP